MEFSMGMITAKATTNSSGDVTFTTPIAWGWLQGISITLTGTHTETNVTIAEAGGMGRTLLTVTDLSASAYYNPQDGVDTTAGAAVTDVSSPFYLSGAPLTITVTDGPNSQTDAVAIKINCANEGSC
jgi:hypothetical protein